MLVPVTPDHPFAGVFVRLRRADENILNLQCETRRFFQECKYPIMPDPDDKRWQDAIDYHRTLYIPKRFSILAGEIFHHWRSCLDHIVWHFSSQEYRGAHDTAIQFPIFVKTPNSDEAKRLKRQIGGVPDPSAVRDLIIKLQPYNFGADAENCVLTIIHDMDRFDKHRELVIVQSTGNLHLPPDSPPDIVAATRAYANKEPLSDERRKAVFAALKQQGKVIPDVAFAEFGQWKNQFVVPSLQKLSNEMENVVAAFMAAGGT